MDAHVCVCLERGIDRSTSVGVCPGGGREIVSRLLAQEYWLSELCVCEKSVTSHTGTRAVTPILIQLGGTAFALGAGLWQLLYSKP